MPLETLEAAKAETMLQVVQADTMPLCLMNRMTPGLGIILLSKMISDTATFLNLGKNMSGAQIAETVELILSDVEAKNLKPEDFKLLFANGKKGAYGKTYDRLDGQVIFEWIRAYTGERMALCEQLSIKEHNQVKKQSNLITPEMAEYYKQILKNVKKEVEDSPKIAREPKRPPEKTERDKLIQMLFAEFEDTCRQKGITDGKPYLRVDGKMLDQVEWVEYKLAEMAKNPD